MTGLRRIESGIYEHPLGRYRVERVDSLGEGWSQSRQQYVETTTSVWVVAERDQYDRWEEIAGDFMTKRAAVDELYRIIRNDNRVEREQEGS